MLFVAISDTHCRHRELKLPKGDVLLHAGDITVRGQRTEFADFLTWFSTQPFRHKIFIGGNHDFFLERFGPNYIQALLPKDVHYLYDSGVNVGGIQVWGSPVTPRRYQWAFNKHRGADMRRHWEQVPTYTDVLLTHGPAYGILDTLINQRSNGDVDLLECVERIKPTAHVFGHIHEAYGKLTRKSTRFFNCSVLNEYNELVNRPFTFTVKPKDQSFQSAL